MIQEDEQGKKTMRKYILILGLFTMITILSGCYTVVWSPDAQLPSSQGTEEEYYIEDGYYADPYYGGYGYYYQYPWWLNITEPAVTKDQSNRENNTTMERIRNRDGARNDSGGRTERIVNTPPTGTSSGGSSSSGNSKVDSGKRNTESKSNNTDTSSTTTRQNNGSNDDVNRTRNNEGSRNTGGRR